MCVCLNEKKRGVTAFVINWSGYMMISDIACRLLNTILLRLCVQMIVYQYTVAQIYTPPKTTLCVCVCAYHCSKRWCVESHPGPQVHWMGSQLLNTDSRPEAGAASQRFELPASWVSVSWESRALSDQGARACRCTHANIFTFCKTPTASDHFVEWPEKTKVRSHNRGNIIWCTQADNDYSTID